MTTSKIETGTDSELNLASEDRSRGVGRDHRLLTIVAAAFVFLALCLMMVDFGRLDRVVPKHESPYRHQLRPVKLVRNVSPRGRAELLFGGGFYGAHHSEGIGAVDFLNVLGSVALFQ